MSALAGCSLYPIPDDVTPIKTEEIVRYGRCEMRAAVISRVMDDKERLARIWENPTMQAAITKALDRKKLTMASAGPDDFAVALVTAIEGVVRDAQERNKASYEKVLKGPRSEIRRKLQALQRDLEARLGEANGLRKYLDVVVVYEFEFEITEQNRSTAEAGFKLPLAAPSVVDVDASASLLLTRKGKRTFKAQDKWSALVTKEERCKAFAAMEANPVYPLGGSIGVDRVVTTFLDLVDQGGSKDSFVDALVFTTEASGGLNATIKLSPVSHAFRLVSAEGHLGGSRLDAHKLTVSLVFPKQDSPEAIFGVDRFDGELDTPFDRPADWRARYNLCVADARGREDALKTLRQTAPEIYCIQYADAFDPQYGTSPTAQKVKSGAKPAAPVAPQGPATRRPNFVPY